MKNIHSISIVTQAGASSHFVGTNNVISIKEEHLFIDGNPYLFYVGRDENGEMVFKVSCLCPVEIIYS